MSALCGHKDAEPVRLSTGEIVAALCPACDERLSARFLDCEHPQPIDCTALGDPEPRFFCSGCTTVIGEPT